MKDYDTIAGCLIGGAIGDSLGYAVEFLPTEKIFEKYGPLGIQKYDPIDGVLTDDTQMTLFTAAGMIQTVVLFGEQSTDADFLRLIFRAYRDWWSFQSGHPLDSHPHTWLIQIPAMRDSRAPGNTCLREISKNTPGSTKAPCNDRKGCGGIMRVAPVSLYCKWTREEAMYFAAETSALTHGHELGYIPSAMLVSILYRLSEKESKNSDILRQITEEALSEMKTLYGTKSSFPYFERLMHTAISLSEKPGDDIVHIESLGEGWVAEETLAIALYCALKYTDQFSKAVRASVNHKGDSDSTGAVLGNILGAYHGYKKIPSFWKENLECRKEILQIAKDLTTICSKEMWDEHFIARYLVGKERK